MSCACHFSVPSTDQMQLTKHTQAGSFKLYTDYPKTQSTVDIKINKVVTGGQSEIFTLYIMMLNVCFLPQR